MTTPRDLRSKTVDELRTLARALGLKGYSKLRKDELVRLLAERQPVVAPPPIAAAAMAPSRQQAPPIPRPRALRAAAAIGCPEPAARLQPHAAAPLGAEERIESAKFALAQPDVALSQPSPGADLGEDIERLPALRAPRLALLPQKPGILHAYWALPDVVGRPLRLRLGRIADDELQIIEEIALPATGEQWYFHLPEALDAGEFFVHLGYYETDGRFVSALERAIARLPSLYASQRADRSWWISEERFRALYLRAGGFLRAGRLGWPGSASSR
jgi:hypothetical protein